MVRLKLQHVAHGKSRKQFLPLSRGRKIKQNTKRQNMLHCCVLREINAIEKEYLLTKRKQSNS